LKIRKSPEREDGQNIIPKKMIKIIKRSPANTSNSPDGRCDVSENSVEKAHVQKQTLPLKSIKFVNMKN
jgi:hypothetical protein